MQMPLNNPHNAAWARLTAGQAVRSISGRSLGVVGEVGEAAFRLDLGDETQIWLRPDAIFTIESNLVSLICERNGVYRFEARTG